MTKWNNYKITNYKTYFNVIPSEKFVETLLEIVYGFKQWNIYHSINKIDNYDISEKLIDFLPYINEYLKPHIIKKYFYSFKKICFNQCITLLHKFLLSVGWNIRYQSIITLHKYNTYFKYQKYYIYKLNDVPIVGIKIRNKIMMYFD
jgi:hypothetical protein